MRARAGFLERIIIDNDTVVVSAEFELDLY